MSHDFKGAQRVLLSLAEIDRSQYRTKQREVASQLINEFLEGVARLDFLTVLPAEESGFVVENRGVVRFHKNGTGIKVWAQHLDGLKSSAIAEVKLSYDYVDNVFTATETDESIVPEPGKPYPKKSVMTAMAEAAIEALNGIP